MKFLWIASLLLASCAASAVEPLPTTAGEQQLVDNVVQAFRNRDTDALAQQVDARVLMGRTANGLKFNEKERADFVTGGQAGIRRAFDNMLGMLGGGDVIIFFKHKHQVDNETRLLFRIKTSETDGIVFIDFIVNKSNKIVDWFSYAEAAKASDLMRKSVAIMLNDSSFLSTVFGGKQLDQHMVNMFRRYSQLIKAQQFKDALDLLDQMPEEFKKLRFWASLRAGIAGNVNDESYRAALTYLADHFGNDPDLQFALVDHYYFQNDMTNVIQALDNVQTAIGEDSELQLLACASLKLDNKLEAALQRCQRSAALDPTLENAYWIAVEIGLQQNNGQLVVDLLTAYENAFDKELDPEQIAELEQYRKIAQTKEFQQWVNSRKADAAN